MTTPINLINVALNWGSFPHQQAAATWLQTQVENKELHGELAWHFARGYRDNDNGSAINFVDVFDHYAALPHQNVALGFLQCNVKESVMTEFGVMFRATPPTPPPTVVTHINNDVPWYFQRTPRTCFSASVAMGAMFNSAIFRRRFGIGATNAYQQYVAFLHGSHGDTTDPQAHIRALRAVGLNPQFFTTMSLAAMMDRLLTGQAMPYGKLHRGSMQNPTGGGHWACARGFTPERTHIIVNDPWGSLNDGYTGDINNGRNVQYSRAQMNHRFTVETPGKDSNHGWAMIIPIDR